MVGKYQSLHSRNTYSPARPQNIPLYGCQSLRLGSSSGTDESILSWSLVGRPIPAPYRHVGNNGHSFRTDKNLKIYSPSLCHDLYRQHKWPHISTSKEEHIPPTYAWRYGRLSLGFVISQANSMFWQTDDR